MGSELEPGYSAYGAEKAASGTSPGKKKERAGRFFAFDALTVKNYRWYASANLISSISLWTVRTAQDWIVLQLSGRTVAVGVTVALQFLPTLLFGPIGGLLVDRYDKRKLLIMAQSVTVLVGVALASLTLSGYLQVWHIYVTAAVTGLSTVVDNPSRMVYFSELVGKKYLKNAVSINSIIFQLGAMLGPAFGGVLLNFIGGGWVFLCSVIAGSYAISVIWRIKASARQERNDSQGYKEQFLVGWRYFWGQPAIRYTGVMLFCTALFAFALPVMMAAFARYVFKLEADGFGLLNSCVALGSLSGALLSTKRQILRLRTVVFGGIRVGAVMIFASLVPLCLPTDIPFRVLGVQFSLSLLLFGGMMALVGFANLLFLTSANQLVQLSTGQDIRGRVMSFYTMFLLGGQSLGGPLVGQLTELLHPGYVLCIAGAVLVGVGVCLALYLKKSGHLKFSVLSIGRRFTAPVD